MYIMTDSVACGVPKSQQTRLCRPTLSLQCPPEKIIGSDSMLSSSRRTTLPCVFSLHRVLVEAIIAITPYPLKKLILA